MAGGSYLRTREPPTWGPVEVRAPQVFLVLLAPPDCLVFKESEASGA